MSEKESADFYLGRGDDAVYLGTMHDGGDPDELGVFATFQSLSPIEYGEDEFQADVAELIDTPEWPEERKYHTSVHTAWSYMYENSTVYVYRYGVEMGQIRCNWYRWAAKTTRQEDSTLIVDPTTKVRERKPPTAKYPYVA